MVVVVPRMKGIGFAGYGTQILSAACPEGQGMSHALKQAAGGRRQAANKHMAKQDPVPDCVQREPSSEGTTFASLPAVCRPLKSQQRKLLRASD